MNMKPYHIPLSLTILGSVFIGLAACISLFIAVDIILRKGWRSMMSIMYLYSNLLPKPDNINNLLEQDPRIYTQRTLSLTADSMDLLEI